MADIRIRYTFDMVLAVEMAPAAIKAFSDAEPIEEPDGRVYFPLGEKRASAVATDEGEARRKAIRTAAYFFKQDHPDWADSHIRGLSPTLVRSALVR